MIKTEQIREYYDNFLDHLKQDHQRENPRHTKIKQDLKQIIKKDFNVLDIGCGTGITTEYIAGLGAKVTGMDLSPKLIEFAKENSAHKNAEYMVQDISALSTKVTSGCKKYDAICLIDTVEHIPRDKMTCLFRVINFSSQDNTVVYLNIPDARFQEYMKQNHPEKLQIVDETYTLSEIMFWFECIGFEAIKIEIYGLDLPAQYINFIFVRDERILRNYKKYWDQYAKK